MSAPSPEGLRAFPLRLRLLLLPFPAAFRRDFGRDVCAFARRQRREARYGGRLLGPLRYWRDVWTDAAVNGVRMRAEAMRRTAGRGGRGDGGDRYDSKSRRGGGTVDGMMRDLTYAVRSLRKSPGYSLLFVLTLGLGIGANTAIFSAVNGVLLKPLPHEGGDRLIYLRHQAPRVGIENALFSVPEIDDYRIGVPSLEEVAEFSALTFTLLGEEEPRRVRTGIVTGNFFPTLGLSAIVGRTLGPGDQGEAADPVAVLTYEHWQRIYGGDPSVVGTTVEINGRTVTIVGVLEPAPPYPERTDIYVNMVTSPHHLDATMNHDRAHRMTEVFARLAPRATLETAQAEIRGITARVHAEYPDAYDPGSGYEVSATFLKDQLTLRARPTLLILVATGALVLLIACANLANLSLSRFLRRDHEFAVRASLGGARSALRRQLLAESLVLSVAGALLGLAVATVGLDVLVRYAGRFTVRASEIQLDGVVYAFALAVAALASVFFAWIPKLPGGDSLSSTLTRAGARSTGGSKQKHVQRGLVVAQIGVSFVLLIGAGLLVRTLIHLQQMDPGFDTEPVLTMDIPVSTAGRTEEDVRSFYESFLDQVRALPSVNAAALSNSVPLTAESGSFTTMFEIAAEGFEPAPGSPTPRADFRVVTPQFFETLGIEFVRGRDFLATDGADAQPVVIVNQSLADAYFPGQDPVGRRIAWTDEILRFLEVGKEWRTVVGVVSDTHDDGFDGGVVHAMYTPYEQVSWAGSLVVRAENDPLALVEPIRRLVHAWDRSQPIVNVATIAQLSRDSVAPQRLNTVLVGSFALLALVIAAVGIGGVLAFSVGNRIQEFGIKGALGASQRQIRGGILSEGVTLAGLGLGVGLIGALGLTRYISGLLYGVPATDPVTYLLVGLTLGGVALGAAWLPAWRASRVDPLEALRAD